MCVQDGGGRGGGVPEHWMLFVCTFVLLSCRHVVAVVKYTLLLQVLHCLMHSAAKGAVANHCLAVYPYLWCLTRVSCAHASHLLWQAMHPLLYVRCIIHLKLGYIPPPPRGPC